MVTSICEIRVYTYFEETFSIDREISIVLPLDHSTKISFTFSQSPIARRFDPISLFSSTPRNRLVSVCSLSKFVSAKVRRFPRRIPLFHTPEFPPPSYYLNNRNSPTRVNLIMCSCRTPRQPAEFWILAIPLVRCTWDTESLEKKASPNEPRDGKEGERRKIEEGKNHESL